MWLLHPKDYYPKMGDFYSSPESYDVWFMGSSHVIMGVLPEELYKEYGIKSYNLAEYGQGFPIDYWLIRNLIKQHKPDLIVLDLAYIGVDELYSEKNITCVKRMVTSLPLCKEKISMIDNLFDGDLREEMLFPFASDHYNWQNLSKSYFELSKSYELGADQNVFRSQGKDGKSLVSPMMFPQPIQNNKENEGTNNSYNMEYYKKILDLCNEEEIDVLVTKIPMVQDEEKLLQYYEGFNIASQYGIPYVDGLSVDAGFNGQTDLWDANHLNSLGARKWTSYIGKYIEGNYPSIAGKELTEKEKKIWDERYEKYLGFLNDFLPYQIDLYSYLLLCTHPQYQVEIVVTENSLLFDDQEAICFLNEIGEFPELENSITNHLSYYGISSVFSGNMISDKIEAVEGDIQIIVYNEKNELIDRAVFASKIVDGKISYERK